LPEYVPPILVEALTQGGVLTLGLVVATAIAVVVARTVHPRYQFIARLAGAWAVAPLAVLLPVMLLRPNLLRGRYIIFVLPGWVILGALSIVVVMEVVSRALARLTGGTEPTGAALRGLLIRAATYSVGALAVAWVVATQVGTLTSIRTPGGHGEDIRPALVATNRSDYAQLPIVVSPPNNAVEVAAYARAEEHRLVGVHIQRDQPSIWPRSDPLSKRRQDLGQHSRVVLLLKGARTPECRWSRRRPPATYVSRCLPRPFHDRGYHVESAEADGRDWTFAVLTYRSPDQ
jgi:hypothetical protein